MGQLSLRDVSELRQNNGAEDLAGLQGLTGSSWPDGEGGLTWAHNLRVLDHRAKDIVFLPPSSQQVRSGSIPYAVEKEGQSY